MLESEVVGEVKKLLRPRPKHLQKPSATADEEVWDLFTTVIIKVHDQFGSYQPAFQPGSGLGNHTYMDEQMIANKLFRPYERVRAVAQQMLLTEA